MAEGMYEARKFYRGQSGNHVLIGSYTTEELAKKAGKDAVCADLVTFSAHNVSHKNTGVCYESGEMTASDCDLPE